MASPQLDEGYTRLANSIIEAIMLRDFTKRQRKILDMIFRLSYGCNKKVAIIPHQRDFELVGVYEGDVHEQLAWLETSKIIIRNGPEYAFNKDFDQWQISRVHPFQPNKLGELLSLNLNGLSRTLSENIVKHEVGASQNTKFATPELASPKDTLKTLKDNPKGFILPQWVNLETWNAFMEVRHIKKAPPTDQALKRILSKLTRLKAEGYDPEAVLSQSIESGWPGVFPINGKVHQQPRPIQDYRDVTGGAR